MTALRRAPERSDLPSAEEVGRIAREKKWSVSALYVLAGLAEQTPVHVLELPDANQRSAAALRLTFHAGSHGHEWFCTLARNRPRLVSDVLILLCSAFFSVGKTPIPELELVAFDADFRPIAAMVTLPLLKNFPPRATEKQLGELDKLLWAGLGHTDNESFLDIVESRVARPGMTGAQRTHWLTAGLCCAPEDFLARLQEHVGDSERKIRHLIGFLTPRRPVPALLERLHVPRSSS